MLLRVATPSFIADNTLQLFPLTDGGRVARRRLCTLGTIEVVLVHAVMGSPPYQVIVLDLVH
jgi:hypothetical protein